MSSSPFHHSAFYQGTKKIVPLKIRNPSIHPSQIMPSPSGVPFNVQDMPWSYTGKPSQVMEFNAVIRPSPILHSPQQLQAQLAQYQQQQQIPCSSTAAFPDLRKRKPEPDVVQIPQKLFLTEEVMASHLSKMHLSSEYTPHNIETEAGGAVTPLAPASPSSSLDDEMSLGEIPGGSAGASTSGSHHVYMSPQELEDRLKKAQRISLCEEVRKLDTRAEILPKVLLERIEKPCTALVIWQPPQPLDKLVAPKVGSTEKDEEERRPNEMMMGEDDPLPDLPDYDDDLDFEENNNNVASVGDLNSMDVEM